MESWIESTPTMSIFFQAICINSFSLVCRKCHTNYFFAKNIVQNVSCKKCHTKSVIHNVSCRICRAKYVMHNMSCRMLCVEFAMQNVIHRTHEYASFIEFWYVLLEINTNSFNILILPQQNLFSCPVSNKPLGWSSGGSSK